MTVRAWMLLARSQLLGFVREPAAAVFNMAVPFFIILIQAFAYGDQPVQDDTGHLLGLRVADVLPVSAGATYLMIIGVFGMGVGLSSMAESRTLSSFRLRPGGVTSILSAYGSVLAAMTVLGLLTSVVALALGWQVGIPSRAVLMPPVLLLCLIVFLSLGACVAAVSPSPRSAQGIASALFFPMLFLSGAMFPLSSFPTALRVVAQALPGKHVVDLLSYSWVSDSDFPLANLVYLAIAAAALPPLAAWLFSRREDL